MVEAREDHRGDWVVSLAGYPREVERLLSVNPGVASRVGATVNFPDYTDQELIEILLEMFVACLVWFLLPWLGKSPVRSGHYRPLYRKFFWFGLIPAMAVLFYCGGAPAEEPYVMLSQIASLYYFAHFLIIIPVVSSIEKPEPLPFSITEAVLGKDDGAALGAAKA